MTDIFDNAQELEQRQRDAALAAFARQHPSPTHESRAECLECDDAIPEARRQAVPGCLRCIDCQRIFDRAHRR